MTVILLYSKNVLATIVDKTNGTNDKFYRKVAIIIIKIKTTTKKRCCSGSHTQCKTFLKTIW